MVCAGDLPRPIFTPVDKDDGLVLVKFLYRNVPLVVSDCLRATLPHSFVDMCTVYLFFARPPMIEIKTVLNHHVLHFGARTIQVESFSVNNQLRDPFPIDHHLTRCIHRWLLIVATGSIITAIPSNPRGSQHTHQWS